MRDGTQHGESTEHTLQHHKNTLQRTERATDTQTHQPKHKRKTTRFYRFTHYRATSPRCKAHQCPNKRRSHTPPDVRKIRKAALPFYKCFWLIYISLLFLAYFFFVSLRITANFRTFYELLKIDRLLSIIDFTHRAYC